MTFLNAFMLLGLATIAIPILIHLLNRSKPRLIEWGAMQFLLASLSARNRRIKIEDAILLCMRCLALVALVLAMARPFLPSMSAVPWVLILPGLLVAALCTGIAAIVWSDRVLRGRLLKTAGVMLVVAVLASLVEQRIQARRWLTAGGGSDTVILLDASLSMTRVSDERSNFSRAVEEASLLIEQARSADAISIVLGGPVPQALIRRPTSDRRELLRALRSAQCRPAGGVMSVLEALNLSATLLADGPNVAKRVVIFTDGQAAGWEPQAVARWEFLASNFKSLSAPPRVFCRRLESPGMFRNALVSDIRLSRSVIGTDRPVKVDVAIGNTGTVPVRPAALEWVVDGRKVERVPIIKDLMPQTSEAFQFTHQFDTPGYHVVSARLQAEDDLPADNLLEQVVNVMDRLPVLLIEGASTERFFFFKTAGLIRVALTPREAAAATDTVSREMSYLVEPTIVQAADIATIRDLGAYRVILMADVPRLPAAEAERLAGFVKAGGGLLILPGNRAEPSFYNSWQSLAGEAIPPARIEKRIVPPDPLLLDMKSLTHPAVHLVAQPDQSDLRLGLMAAYWKLGLAAESTSVRACGRLESGEPWLTERQLGRGYILMSAMAFDRRDSNLSTLKCFVPMIHEMVYYLAAPTMRNCNLPPGAEYTLAGSLPMTVASGGNAMSATIIQPSGEETLVPIDCKWREFRLRFPGTRYPGLYHVRLPAVIAAAVGIPTNQVPEALFAVTHQAEESTLTPLGDADIAALRTHVDLFLPGSAGELQAAFTGNVPGQELWKILIICALLTLLAESALTRWITLHRHLHQAKPVELRSPAESVRATKARLAQLMETPS
jgi:hypothetical protein